MALFNRKSKTDDDADRAAKIQTLVDTVITQRPDADFHGDTVTADQVQRRGEQYGMQISRQEAEQVINARLRFRGFR